MIYRQLYNNITKSHKNMQANLLIINSLVDSQVK
nr:MAG TPA: hypothetical protein [Caudoviricetes sp.]